MVINYFSPVDRIEIYADRIWRKGGRKEEEYRWRICGQGDTGGMSEQESAGGDIRCGSGKVEGKWIAEER